MNARNERKDALQRATTIKNEEADIATVSRYLDEYFNEDELGDLTFGLNVKYENLPGDTKSWKARELVDYMRRHGRLYELIETCREKRPHVPWPFLVDMIED